MRISDWSSDVCSSDLSISQEVGREIPGDARLCLPVQSAADGAALPRPGACLGGRPADRSRISLPAFGIAAAGRRTRTRRADLAPAFERDGLQSPALGMSSALQIGEETGREREGK